MAVSRALILQTLLLLAMQAASALQAANVGTGTGLSGSYYANSSLAGTPSLTRIDSAIAFTWNGGSPGAGIPTTNWGARWVGQIQPQYNESYTLFATTDDGVRVWLDDQLVIDAWPARSAADSTYTFTAVADRRYKIRIDYWQQAGTSSARLDWSCASVSRTVVPQTQLYPQPAANVGTGSGLSGYYYANSSLTGTPGLTRTDPTIAFSWNGGSPGAGIPATYWGARWLGQIQPQYNEAYTLFAKTDDGVRVWLDDQLVIDAWPARAAADSAYTFTAVADRRYKIRIDYWQQAGTSTARLEWSSASISRIEVPQTQLYPLIAPIIAFPTSSLISPVCIEGWRDPTALPAVTAAGTNVSVSPLGATRFYANAPLSPTSATALAATSNGSTISGSVSWTSIALSGKEPNADHYRVRIGDSLLLEVPSGVTSASVYRNCGTAPSISFPAGSPRQPVQFSTAGIYDIQIRDSQGVFLGGIRVSVIDASLSGEVACGVNYTRNIDIRVNPSVESGELWCEANDNAWLSVINDIAGSDWQRAKVKPLLSGADARMVARLSQGGPILGSLSIVPFAVDASRTNGLLVDPVTRKGVAEIVIKPFIQNQKFDFSLFAHTGTFLGGAKSFSINTSNATTSLGEPGFVVQTDANGVTYGTFRFSVIIPVGETMYCMDIIASAGNNLYQAQ